MRYIKNTLGKEDTVIIGFSLFCDLTTSSSGGALNLNSYSNRKIDVSHNIFLNNTAPNTDCHGGAIYCVNEEGIDFRLHCSVFRHNAAYRTSSFYISNRISPIQLSVSQIIVSYEYRISDFSHIDVMGGNTFVFKHSNISNNDVPHFGLVLDYIPPKTHDIVTNINFITNTVGDGYILNDQDIMPMNYYMDKWNFVNNTIDNFFGSTSKSREPWLFQCNFIFNENSTVEFNFIIHLESCYFSNAIDQTSNNSISATNDIEMQFDNCCIRCSLAISVRSSCSFNSKILLLYAIFLIKA